MAGLFFISGIQAQNIDLPGPAGSGSFGASVTALPNGNIVVTDPGFDAGATENVGAVYLYNGATGALISTLTGSHTNDSVGSNGITVLTNGNYVVRSLNWDSNSFFDVGAVTWCSKTTGCSGTVSAGNSLIGARPQDVIGYNGVIALPGGNYVVSSPYRDSLAQSDAGAVTWGNGRSGTSGVVSDQNSLVGSATQDLVGNNGIFVLSNGNYVVSSASWDNGPVANNVGAATFGSGASGVSGFINSANSLIGSASNNQVSYGGITPLANGNYVVSSIYWSNGALTNIGAVTWCSGTSGGTGTVSPANSLIGSTANDAIGSDGVNVAIITALPNGNYVIGSPVWDNGGLTNAGASTLGNGTSGTVGTITAANSMVGTKTNDLVGVIRAAALADGNYVVGSSRWSNGATLNTGAATWCSKTTGCPSTITAANSLVGSTDDYVSSDGITALPNGNYLVSSSSWSNDALTDVGAVTFCTAGGTFGTVSVNNSLVGSSANDKIPFRGGVTVLANGNYVVRSPEWKNGSNIFAGAVTWGNANSGTVGIVSANNSLVGSSNGDNVGLEPITVLPNGNYLVPNHRWNNNGAGDAGAVTWCNGASGTFGAVSAANSLVGTEQNNLVGFRGVTVLSNGNYVVNSPFWDNAAIDNAGAVTWGNGASGVSGVVSAANSLVGTSTGDALSDAVYALTNGNYAMLTLGFDSSSLANAGAVTKGNGNGGTTGSINSGNSIIGTAASNSLHMNFSFDALNNQIVVGRPASNIVTLFRSAPSSPTVSVAGRLLSPGGKGIPHALLTLVSSGGQTQYAVSNPFGYYRFKDVPAGQIYTFNIAAKSHSFTSQDVWLNVDLTNLNFTASE